MRSRYGADAPCWYRCACGLDFGEDRERAERHWKDARRRERSPLVRLVASAARQLDRLSSYLWRRAHANAR